MGTRAWPNDDEPLGLSQVMSQSPENVTWPTLGLYNCRLHNNTALGNGGACFVAVHMQLYGSRICTRASTLRQWRA